MPRRCNHPTGPAQPATCQVCRKYVTDPTYAALCDAGLPRRASAPPVAVRVTVGHGPGTELKAILKSLGFSTCGKCSALAERMDAGGADWCRRNRPIIATQLIEARKETGWREKATAFIKALTTGLALTLDPTDPIGSLIDEAIRRAECQPLT